MMTKFIFMYGSEYAYLAGVHYDHNVVQLTMDLKSLMRLGIYLCFYLSFKMNSTSAVC